jgi:hypothetical protein
MKKRSLQFPKMLVQKLQKEKILEIIKFPFAKKCKYIYYMIE